MVFSLNKKNNSISNKEAFPVHNYQLILARLVWFKQETMILLVLFTVIIILRINIKDEIYD
jgi:uncharacterized membrane protein